MPLRVTAVAAAVVLALGTAACASDSASTTTTTAAETSTTLPQSFQVATPDGQVSLSLDGKLPPGWPSGFPLPQGAEAAGSGSLGGSDNTVRVGVFTTDGGGEATLDFYTQDQGLETTGRSGAGVGDNFVGRLTLTSPYSGSVNVVSRQGSTYLVVVLKGDTTASTSSTTAPASITSTTAPAGTGTPQ